MEKPFIIAEIGINHNGDIEIAKKLIAGAKWAGADAVKFQKRTIDKVYSQKELSKYRESSWGTTYRQQKEGLEFGREEYDIIDKYCKILDIEWTASSWDLESVKFLKKYNLKYNKIASPMLGHKELVKEIAKQKKYTFISTGMSTLEEINVVVSCFILMGCPFELMHCNSEYPSKPEDLNLKCINLLQEKFNCNVGYSCHSPDLIPPVFATALGATSIEKHITLDRAMYGSDQAASMTVEGFQKMVKYIRAYNIMAGKPIKTITPGEEKCRKKLRKTKDY